MRFLPLVVSLVKDGSGDAAERRVAASNGKTTRTVVISVVSLLAATSAMVAASHPIQSYKFSSFGFPGSVTSDGSGINNNGQVVGHWVDSVGIAHGFLLSDGEYQSFDVPGALGTFPQDINDAGIVVGSFTVLRAGDPVCCASYGFVRTPDGQYSTIDYPTTNSEIPLTWLFGINNMGQMVGGYNEFELAIPNTSSHGIHSFLLEGEAFTPIDFPVPISRVHIPVTYAQGINDAGIIVGGYNDDTEFQQRHGFIFRNGNYETLDMPGADFTELFDINNIGEIIGESLTCASFAFLYSPKRGFSCIPDTPKTKPTIRPFLALGLNDAGQLVGETTDGDGYFATPPSAK